MKYNCLNNISKAGLVHLSSDYSETTDIKEADVVFVRSAKMDEVEVGEKLLAVARAGAGVNNIPHADYAKKGIVVFNTPGANANAVKELVIAMMLMASRDLNGGIAWVKENAADPDIAKTAEKAKKAFAGGEIMCKTLGVVGLGAIGRLVANAAVDLGMNVIGYDPFLSVDGALALDPMVRHVTDIADLYKDSDFITLHLPAIASTKGMVNADAFAQMKQGVVLVNCARDAIVDEDALLAAIASGKVAKYMSDFANPKVAAAKGCVVTPHLGASTEEAEDNCAVMAVNEIRNFVENGNIVNSVNFPAVSLGGVKSGRVGVCFDGDADTTAKILAAAGKVAASASGLRGTIGYVLIDAESADVAAIAAVPGVTKVRKIR